MRSQTQFWTQNLKNRNKSVWVSVSFRRVLKGSHSRRRTCFARSGAIGRCTLLAEYSVCASTCVRQIACVRQGYCALPCWLPSTTLRAFLRHIFPSDLKWQCAFYWAFRVWHFSSFNLAKERKKKEKKKKENPIGKAEGLLSKKSSCFVSPRIGLREGKSMVASSFDFLISYASPWWSSGSGSGAKEHKLDLWLERLCFDGNNLCTITVSGARWHKVILDTLVQVACSS